MNAFKKFLREEEGVTALEYGILAAIVVGVLLVGAASFKDELAGLWGNITSSLSSSGLT